MTDPTPEDAKIITLARSARVRVGAEQGAAVRDADGRTYVAATVVLPSLRLTALQAAVAAAAASGVRALDAVAVVGAAVELTDSDRVLLAEVGAPRVLLAGLDGRPQ